MGVVVMSVRNFPFYAASAILLTATLMVSRSSTTAVLADSVKCDMSQYTAVPGLTASVEQDLLVVTWAGQNGQDVRVRYALDRGTPTIPALSVRTPGAQWASLGRNLTPEYHYVSGIRRMSTQQAEPLLGAGVE